MRPPHHVAPRDWVGETAILIASGPSTERVDLSVLDGARIIAVAHGYRALQGRWADALVVGGRSFFHHNRLADIAAGVIVAAQDLPSWSWLRAPDPRLVYMNRAGELGLTDDRGSLAGSESSVMLAINYAVHRGVGRIMLLGCDGQPGADGRRRVGWPSRDTTNACERYQIQERAMASQLEPLGERGVEIINCSPGTALTIYPTAALEDAIHA